MRQPSSTGPTSACADGGASHTELHKDLESATSQLQVAESNRNVAKQNLDLTRQRFESGIADSVEVTHALESVATAELDSITTLLSFNLAKLSLVRALGAESPCILVCLNVGGLFTRSTGPDEKSIKYYSIHSFGCTLRFESSQSGNSK